MWMDFLKLFFSMCSYSIFFFFPSPFLFDLFGKQRRIYISFCGSLSTKMTRTQSPQKIVYV